MTSSKPLSFRHIFTTGLAMFSMFFGAGNVVFPLLVGKVAGDMALMAVIGLLITAVGVPFVGLLAMVLYSGNYEEFFNRIGRVPGFLITIFIMILIGPINAMPRCIALSFSTLKMYVPTLSAVFFSFVSCVVIFLMTYKKSRLVDLLGAVLSPLLLVSLAVIIVKGMLFHPIAPAVVSDVWPMLSFGLLEGYNTMDLLGTFFFSGVIITSLRHIPSAAQATSRQIAWYALQASIIGAALLGIIYAGFAYVASYYGAALAPITDEAILLGSVARLVLGNAGGFVVSMAVVLACLTTVVTLAAVFAEFLHLHIFRKVVCYRSSLVLTLIVTFIFANLQFSEIVAMFVPVLIVIYPALVVLCIVNILHKLYGFSLVKTPVVLTALLSAIWYYAPHVIQSFCLLG